MPIVLVVEADPILNIELIYAVEGAGFETINAFSADEALAALATRDDLDILLTDTQTGGKMDGWTLAHKARRAHPGIRLIFVTGVPVAQLQKLPPGAAYLSKPVHQSEVEAALQTVMTTGLESKP